MKLGNRGHWPAGKHRNPDAGHWARTLRDLNKFLSEHHSPGRVSQRALASDLGVAEKAVRKWIAGTTRPDAATQDAVQQWLDMQIAFAEWRAKQRKKRETKQ